MKNKFENNDTINLMEIKELIFNSGISGYEIEKFNGVSRSLLSKVRRGKIDLESLSLRTLIRLQTFVNHRKKES